MTEKIAMYIKELNHLKMALREKLSETKDTDSKNDLVILHKNVLRLIAFSPTLVTTMIGGSRRKTSKKSTKK